MFDTLDAVALEIQMTQWQTILESLNGENAIKGQIQFTEIMQAADSIHPHQVILADGQLQENKNEIKYQG